MTIFIKNLIFFIVFVTFSLDSFQFCASVALVSFPEQCTSLVAENLTSAEHVGVDSSVVHSLVGLYRSSDGSNLLSQSSVHGSEEVQNSIVFRFWYNETADEQGLFRVQGSIEFPKDISTYVLVGSSTRREQSTGMEPVPNVQQSTSSIKLNGIWAEASGELCMVRSGSNLFESPALLKLNNFKNSSSLTSLITGTFESLVDAYTDRNYFAPISISLLPSMNYKYSFASNKSRDSFSDGSDTLPSSLKMGRFCAVISNLVLTRHYVLQYPRLCLNVDSSKNCSPISSYLPAGVSFNTIECLEDEHIMRVLVDFSGMGNQWPFNPNVTLVGEGSWDATKNQVVVVACRFLNVTDSLYASHLGDCSVRLSFWFPRLWTIGNTSSIQGRIWSSLTAAESGYFETITFESGQNDFLRFALPGQEYEYTLTDQVAKMCPRRSENAKETNSYIYRPPFSVSMRFHHSVVNSSGEQIGYGVAVPVSFGNQFFYPWSYSIEDGTQVPLESGNPYVSYNGSNPHNVSYRIDLRPSSEGQLPDGFYIANNDHEMVISAEGVYDDTEGSLCMVGCRDISTNRHQQQTDDTIDCEIVVNFKFPPGNLKHRSYINGSIESTRDKSDILYFERVELTAAAGYTSDEAEQSIWMMDVEIMLSILSNTLACFFGMLQLFHVKRHPEVLASISTCMTYIIFCGYLFPLTLNFNAMLAPLSSQTLLLGSNGWHEFNGLIVNVLAMVGFLLQLRLLLLIRAAREANESTKQLWPVEKLALLVSLPIYVAGSLLMLVVTNWRNREFVIGMVSRYHRADMIVTILKTCASLVLDGFLLPQIVLNIFHKSTEKTLAFSFFSGTTLVRVLPHAYDLYRDHTSGYDQLSVSYTFASPAAYFYTTTWNVMVSCMCILFAVIIYLQQRFGGRCIVPPKLREFAAFGKVNIMSEAP